MNKHTLSERLKTRPQAVPSNPATYWVSSSETASFTFPPGARPFYVKLRTQGWVVISALLFADDEAHVRRILQDLIAFVEDCDSKYQSQYLKHERKMFMLKTALDGDLSPVFEGRVYETELTIAPAPTDQFFNVGWAGNDYL